MGEERLNVLSKGGDCLLGLLCFLMGYKTSFCACKMYNLWHNWALLCKVQKSYVFLFSHFPGFWL